MSSSLLGKSLLSLSDFSESEILWLIEQAKQLKLKKKSRTEKQYLKGKNIALIFDKDSTRTRAAFEVAAYDQGANVTYFGSDGSQIGHKESLKDSAKVLSSMYDAIQYRGHEHQSLVTLKTHATVPVYNGLTDDFHPTQALADLMTMLEHSDKPANEIIFCYVGDCRFNMANSLMLLAAKLGMDVRFLAPDSLQPSQEIQHTAKLIAKETGARILITQESNQALLNCDFVHTDVWLSMGEPFDKWKERIELLRPYQVNEALLKKANNSAVKFMHCLPAIHSRESGIGEELYQHFGLDGAEVTNEVFESDSSIVFEQAENRLHTIKALMVATLSKSYYQ